MINPVLWKECRSKMRGRRPFQIQAAYIFLLSLFFSIGYLAVLQQWDYAPNRSSMGKDVFLWMVFTQLVLVTLIAPAFTCGVVSIEKEQKTLGLLFTTLLSQRHIMWGKLFSSLSAVLLLILSSIPLLCLTITLGGVSPGEIAVTYLLLISSAVTFGMIGLSCSTHFRKTSTATAATYFTILFLVVGVIIIGGLMEVTGLAYRYGSPDIPWHFIGPFSPFFSLAALFEPGGFGGPPDPFGLPAAWAITLIYYFGISSIFYLGSMRAFKRLRRSVY